MGDKPGYGQSVAVMSASGDFLFCRHCGTIVYTLSKKLGIPHQEWDIWLRDLDIEKADLELFDVDESTQAQAESDFMQAVGEGKEIDPYSGSGEPLILLQEGYPEQDIINEHSCSGCMKPLHSFCQDYGPDEEIWHITRDGKELFAGTANACFSRLLAIQPHSVHHATTHEGYKIEPKKV